MITDQIFEQGMNLLMSHFEKQLNPLVLALWKDELDEFLSSEEFTKAVKQLILYFEQRFKGHFPTVKHILDIVNGSKEAKALQEWQSVLLAASRQDESQLAYISQRGRVALQAIGGLRVVGLAEEYRRSQLEKSFVTVYCQCSDRDAHALPPSVQPATKNEPEFTSMPEHLKQQLEALKNKVSMNGK